MALKKRDGLSYGDSQADIRAEILAQSAEGYLAEHFADAVCACGGGLFTLQVDDNEGVAVRDCVGCRARHPIGDSGEFLEDAELSPIACPCGADRFEVTVGVALYPDGETVKWLYLGCRCSKCGFTGICGDWKNQYEDYREFLKTV